MIVNFKIKICFIFNVVKWINNVLMVKYEALNFSKLPIKSRIFIFISRTFIKQRWTQCPTLPRSWSKVIHILHFSSVHIFFSQILSLCCATGNAGAIDSATNTDDSPEYYQPISAAAAEEDNEDLSHQNSDDDHHHINPNFHSMPNGYARCVDFFY